jgi:hypothetical protein
MTLQFKVERGKLEKVKERKVFKWYATVNGAADSRFSFGFEIPRPDSKNKRGLTFLHEVNEYGLRYDPQDYLTAHGHWANIIYPMAQCETDGYFNAVNTYDKAFFSFGFVQMTVEHANAQFIHAMRALLAEPKAADYFPELTLREVGKVDKVKYIHLKVADDKYVQLETRTNAKKLQKYLNPTPATVEWEEAERAARFAHWASNEKGHRDIQVRAVVEHLKERMGKVWADWYGLDGRPDTVCLVVCDIHHQGRGKRNRIRRIFKANGGDNAKLYAALLEVGGKDTKNRREKLDKEIQKMVASGTLGKKKYSKASNDFV